MPNRPVVPSKDALRALRSLAYSSPATLLGTVGALCGIVTVHYHERQRLQKIQRILETKRKLQSISQGRGSARMAIMFEAAERGEDFTMHNNRRRRLSGRRHHSAISMKSTMDGDEDLSMRTSEEITIAESNEVGNESESMNKQDYSYWATPSNNVSDHSTPFPLRDSLPTSAVEHRHKVLSASKIATIHDSIGIWGAVSTAVKNRRARTARETSASMRRSQVLPQATPTMMPSTNQAKPVDQPISDLHPIRPSAVDADEYCDPLADVTEANSITFHSDLTKSIIGNAFSMLQPWQSMPTDQESQEYERQTEHEDKFDLPISEIYVTSSGQVPPVTVHHPFQSRYDLRKKQVQKGMSLVGADRYHYVYNSLMNWREERGDEAALTFLSHIMHRYTRTDKRSDFALVQALFLDCTRCFSVSQLKPLVHRFVETFLRGDEPRIEVVSFLYPGCGASGYAYKQHYYFLAHQYLEAMHKKGYSLDRQVMELRKLLVGTQMCNVPLHEHLVIPVLRSLRMAGRMESAQALLDEMEATYKINASFYSLQELVKGYGQAGDWSRVDKLLNECHSREWAHKKVYGLTSLLAVAVDAYAQFHPAEKVMRFTMRNLRQYDVHPVSSLTREIVSLCLRERRYDLVADWMNVIRLDYPQIDTGTGSSTFAFDISCVWKDTDASCEEILNGCRAIASNALRDPFSKTFRSTVSEAVTRYLKPRLVELSGLVGVDVPERLAHSVKALDSFLTRLGGKGTTGIQNSRIALLVSHLQAQAQALHDLDRVCGGHWQLRSFGQRHLLISGELDTADEAQGARPLPPFSALEEIVMKQYAQRVKSDRPVEHGHLRDVAVKLAQQGRESHAFDLIQTVYDSRWVQAPTGREFDLDIYVEWLKLASDLKSGTKVRTVLWAIVDAGPHLDLSAQTVLLARIAAPKSHLSKVKHARSFETDEVEYLRMRLKRRRWSTTMSQSHPAIRLRTWDGLGGQPAILDDEMGRSNPRQTRYH